MTNVNLCTEDKALEKLLPEYESSWFCQKCLDIVLQEQQAANSVPLATSSAGAASSSAGIAPQSTVVVREKWPPAREMSLHSVADRKRMKDDLELCPGNIWTRGSGIISIHAQ